MRFQVTGKENCAPWINGPFGRVLFEHCQVLSPVEQPLIEVIPIRAVQLIVFVFVLPIGVLPKSTGDEHLSGSATGDPRQMTLPLLSET